MSTNKSERLDENVFYRLRIIHEHIKEEASGVGLKYISVIIKKIIKFLINIIRQDPPIWYLFYWILFAGVLLGIDKLIFKKRG